MMVGLFHHNVSDYIHVPIHHLHAFGVLIFPDSSKNVAIADILDQLDQTYQQEAEKLLPERLNSILDRLSSTPRATVQSDILEMVNDIHGTVIQSFRQRMAGVMLDNSEPASQENSSSAGASRIEPSSDHPASLFFDYLNNIDQEGSPDSQPDMNLGSVISSMLQ